MVAVTGDFIDLISCLDVQTSVFCSILCLAWIYILFRKPSGLPPGPSWRRPILGHLGAFRGGDLRRVLNGYRVQYGDIYSLYLGRQLVVVVNGLDAIKEVCVAKSDQFVSLPSLAVLRADSANYANISAQTWLELRTIDTASLQTFGFDDMSIQSSICDEINLLLEELETHNDSTFDPRYMLVPSIFNVNCSVLMRTSYSHGDLEFHNALKLARRCNSAGGSTGLTQFLPFLRRLPGDLFKCKKLQSLSTELKEFFDQRIERCRENMGDSNSKDFISAFLKAEKQRTVEENGHARITDDNLRLLLSHVLITCSESTVEILTCAIQNLTKYLDIQERIYDELRQLIGKRKQPSLSDRSRLVYTQAFITEIQRLAKSTALKPPHTAHEHTTVRGYRIPKGTVVFPDMQSVMLDPELWDEPKMFNPDRFISKQGNLTKPENFIPYFTGHRTALGNQLASAEVFLFLSSLVLTYQFLPASENSPCGVANRGSNHGRYKHGRGSLEVRIRRRNGRTQTEAC